MLRGRSRRVTSLRLSLHFTFKMGACEVAQQLKDLAAKPVSLSWILRTLKVEGESQHQRIVFSLLHVHFHLPTHEKITFLEWFCWLVD
jgi:hypothetical protein